jgi:hypothetical protein
MNTSKKFKSLQKKEHQNQTKGMIDKTPDFRNWNLHFSEKLPDVFEFICTDPTMFFEFHQFAGVSVYWILATWFRLVYFFRKQIQRIYQNLILCIPMYVLNIAINLGYGYYQFGPHWVYWAPYWLLPIRSWRIRSKKIQKSMQNTQHLHWFNTNVHCSSTFQDLCGRWEYKTYNVKKSSTETFS